ncbi:MAG: hypothetical protein AAFR26_23620 [Cyanobacteria bacterium J06626_4]
MNTRPLRHLAVAYAKFATVGLLLAVAVGCGANQSEPEADVSVAPASTTETATTETANDASDATATEPAAASSNPPAAPAQAAPPQGEPGYIGYPLMGETAAGEPIYYISSELIDCPDAGCVSISFLQVDAADADQTMDGQAVGNCTTETLSEVMLDGDLVAYEMASLDAGMAALLNTACQANRPGEPGASTAATVAPTVPAGLEEGMPYGEVRSRLIDAGWVAKTTRMDHYTGLEQDMYDRGYTEIRGCSGTGLCRFEFNSSDSSALADSEALIVITSFADSDFLFEEDPVFGAANIGPTY